MQILVHLGLNKCASTTIQRALAAAQAGLCRNGVFYPVEGGRPAQYGLSRQYGFGPDVDGVTPRSLRWLMAEASRRHCTRMILSSEYLSLHRPAAIAAFVADLEALGADARFLIFSREPVPWLRSLFNQYVKTVDSGPHFRSIDAFADHVLTNGAIDIARRYQAWADAVGASRLAHHRIAPGQPPEDVLTPFSAFAGLPIAAAEPGANRSLSPGALYLTGLIRQGPADAGPRPPAGAHRGQRLLLGAGPGGLPGSRPRSQGPARRRDRHPLRGPAPRQPAGPHRGLIAARWQGGHDCPPYRATATFRRGAGRTSSPTPAAPASASSSADGSRASASGSTVQRAPASSASRSRVPTAPRSKPATGRPLASAWLRV